MSAEPMDQKRFEAARRERARLASDVRQRSALRLHGLLRSSIRHGLFEFREHLHEEGLIEEYGTSRNAVRQALSLLVEEGLVSRGPRNGTVVVGQIATLSLDDRRGEAADELSSYRSQLVDDARVPTTPLIRNKLDITDDRVRMSEWIYFRQNVAYCVMTSYWVGEDNESSPLIVENMDAGFDKLFEKHYGQKLARVDYSVESVRCDEQTGRALRVPVGTSLLFKERVLIAEDGHPREYSHTHYVANQIALTISNTITHD
jgi:GntR family transcriptional regulator